MSTNDTVLVLANGLAGNTPIATARRALLRRYSRTGSNYVMLELAKMIVR
jgi:N-acetylglutamate synthase/N-acetylornithine aminotransferase